MVQPISYIKQSGEIIIVDLRQKKKKVIARWRSAHEVDAHAYRWSCLKSQSHCLTFWLLGKGGNIWKIKNLSLNGNKLVVVPKHPPNPYSIIEACNFFIYSCIIAYVHFQQHYSYPITRAPKYRGVGQLEIFKFFLTINWIVFWGFFIFIFLKNQSHLTLYLNFNTNSFKLDWVIVTF